MSSNGASQLCLKTVPNSVSANPDTPVRRIERQTLRAPAKHGQSLQAPPLSTAAELIAANQARLGSLQLELAGNPLVGLREELTADLLARAWQYTRAYRDVDSTHWNPTALIASGHQPRLFHPGVWFKNCALSELAASGRGTPLNLVVDNDLCGLSAIPVPVQSGGTASFVNCHYDQTGESLPFEVRGLLDRELFQSFANRLGERIEPLVDRPLVGRLWRIWEQLPAEFQTNLGRGLAAARHALEAEFGWHTLELPLSELCRTRAFACFLAEILLRAPEFREDHNQSLEQYRQINRIRSKSHPVPALAVDGPWQEVPFWIYSPTAPKRERLFVRHTSGTIELSNRGSWSHRLDARNLVEQLTDLLLSSICLRTRALTTTLFSRLVASDLFLHGIGGAKYDELTNELARRFFGLELPQFMTLTATIRLPGHENPVTASEITRHEVLRRELQFHPEQHLMPPSDPSAARLASELTQAKQQLLASHALTPSRRNWQRDLEQVNAQLATLVQPLTRKLDEEIDNLGRAHQCDAVLGSREIAFCCFPESLAGQLEAATRSHSSASK